MSSESYIDLLLHGKPLLSRPLRLAIQALQPPPGSRGLDAGCGIGLQAVPLARAVGRGGRVTGLDLCPEHLAYARRIVEEAGLSERITFEEGDVRHLPFDSGSFDWAWSMDCVGYFPLEALGMVKELARVVKPGGSVAVVVWSSQMLLPGYPQLEARLNATSAGIAPFTASDSPESHHLRALGWLREVGLQDLTVHACAGGAHAPLTDELRRALTELITMRWPGVESELTPEDRKAYQRLCLPESPDFIVDHPDYYACFTYSMFLGRVAGVSGSCL